MMMPSYSASHD